MQNTSTVVFPSSTGGTIVETYDQDGKRIGVRHTPKTGAYSGSIAQKEGKKPAKR